MIEKTPTKASLTMQNSTLALTLCLALGLFASLAIADNHGESKKVAPPEGWTDLIPDEGLEGWDTKNKETYWKLEDGKIVGENTDKRGSDLWSDQEFGDYEIIVEYQNQSPGDHYDSGVYLRGGSHQVQIGISGSLRVDLTGCIYCPKDGNGKYPQMPKDKVKEAHKLGEWNNLRVVTKGKNIKTYLNGELINDYDGVKYPEKGKIGLQLHANVHMKIAFKTVMVKEIESE